MNLRCHLHSVAGRSLFLGLLAVSLAAVMLVSLGCGVVPLTPGRILEVFFQDNDSIHYQILCNIRLPRILLGALVGAAFAVSGAILQSVMRNPLASPGIIGVSSGGGLAGILVLLAFPQFAGLLVPAAFVGALSTAFFVYLLAWKRGASPVRLILSGVAVGAMLGAFSSAIMLFHAEKAGNVLAFAIGTLAARGWPQLHTTVIYIVAGLLAAFALAGRLNILALGDEVALALGMKVERTRFLLIALASLLAAAAVSVVGLLGFVGLIAPHVVRLLIGSDNRFLLPAAALFGAMLVVGCDTIGRAAMGPSELPVGIIMALLGPPFFLFLLRRHHYEA